MIDPRVKTQAKRKNYSSRALKWDIVCICSLNTFGFTIRFEKRLGLQFIRFGKKVTKSLYKITKMRKLKNWHFLFLIIYQILFELQRCTVPHFKALEE